VRRVERPHHRLRDTLYLILALLVLTLTIVGATSTVAFVLGSQIFHAAKPHAAPPGTPRVVVRVPERAAAAVLAHARQERRRLLQRARAQARALLRAARRRASHRPVPTKVPPHPRSTAPAIQPTPAPAARAPIGTPAPARVGSRPSGSLPAGWAVAAVGSNPWSRTVQIRNRSAVSFSGVVTMTFVARNGGVLATDLGHFGGVPPHSTVTVHVFGADPRVWYRYRIAVSDIR